MFNVSHLTEIGICVLVVALVVSSKQFRSIFGNIPPFYTVCVALATLALFGGHLYRHQYLTFPFADWRMYGKKVPAGSAGMYDEYLAILGNGGTTALSPYRVSITGRKMIYRLEHTATAIVRKTYGISIPADDYNLKPTDEYIRLLRGVAILYSKKNGGVKVRAIQVTRCWLPPETYPLKPIRRKLWTVDLES